MRKLISLFLILVMFLMLAPAALAAVDLPVNETSIDFGSIQAWSGIYSSYKSFTITNPYATNTDVIIACNAGVEISLNAVTGYSNSLTVSNFASPTSSIAVYVRPTDATWGIKGGNIIISYTDADYNNRVIPFTYTVYNSSSVLIPSSSYSNRTLTDSATGVRVSGLSIHNSAALSVTQNSLHSSGLCNACDTIRSYMSNGQVLSIYNISMTRSHSGTVNVSIPVSSGYNGSRLTIAHCNGGVLESQDVYASNGMVTGAFSSLSPFAVLSGQYINTNTNNNTSSSNGIAPPKTDDPISYKALGELVILLTAVTGFIVMRSKKKAKR